MSSVWKTTTDEARAVADEIKFGTDGWRGVMADDFTFPNLRRAAAGTIAFLQKNPPARQGPLLIGYDRRFFPGSLRSVWPGASNSTASRLR